MKTKQTQKNRLTGCKKREPSNDPKIEILFQRLEKLKDFLNIKKSFSAEEITSWVSACVSLFTEINLNNRVIDGFMRTFEHEPVSINGLMLGMKDNKVGPFSKGTGSIDYKLDNGWGGRSRYPASSRIYYVSIAFTSAKGAIQRMEEEARLIPKFLINSFSNKEQYSHIVSSLELIEKAYQEKNSDGLIKNSITLLDSILDLNKLLAEKGTISKKLRELISNDETRNKFGIKKEFVFALDNSRIIRNQKSVHKTKLIKYDISFLVALGCAYLVIMFLEITMATGEVIK